MVSPRVLILRSQHHANQKLRNAPALARRLIHKCRHRRVGERRPGAGEVATARRLLELLRVLARAAARVKSYRPCCRPPFLPSSPHSPKMSANTSASMTRRPTAPPSTARGRAVTLVQRQPRDQGAAGGAIGDGRKTMGLPAIIAVAWAAWRLRRSLRYASGPCSLSTMAAGAAVAWRSRTSR